MFAVDTDICILGICLQLLLLVKSNYFLFNKLVNSSVIEFPLLFLFLRSLLYASQTNSGIVRT